MQVPVSREIEVEAPPEDVWEALVDEDHRERWLDEPAREIEIVEADAPHRLVWHWSDGAQPPTRVEIDVLRVAAGSRVIVTESVPAFPLPALAACFALVAA
ncbi:MAG: SRPBCC family protein [Solirubrobacteraceae bacterium]